MGDVVDFDGTTTADLPADKVLEGAKQAELEHVIVIGVQPDGTHYYAATTSDPQLMLWLTESFKMDVLFPPE